MGSSAEREYAAFEDKVRRTVFFDNLSPQVTESVLKSALDQFANVKSVKFIPNYIEPKNVPKYALVELDSAKKAQEVISMMAQYPFMMSGMPRPVRARPAVVSMFDDRPIKPGRKVTCRWVEPGDPDFQVAQDLKRLTCKHAAESAFLLKVSLFLCTSLCLFKFILLVTIETLLIACCIFSMSFDSLNRISQ